MMKRTQRMRLQRSGSIKTLGGIAGVVSLLVAMSSSPVLAQPTKTTTCVTNGCHIQSIATAGVGMIWGVKVASPAASLTTSPTTITVAAGSNFEVDFIVNKVTYATGNAGMSFMVALPTGWTINAQGTTTGANPAGWKTVWDQTGGSNWRTGTVLTTSNMWASSPQGYSIDYTGNANWAVTTGAAYDNGSTTTPGDKDGVADQMGTDVVVNVPAGTTAGNYQIQLIGVGHDASKKGYYNQLITVTVQSAGDSTAPVVGTVTPANTATATYVDGTFDLSAPITEANALSSCQYTINNGGAWSAGTVGGSAPNWTCTATNISGGADGASLTLNIRGTDGSANTGTGSAMIRTVDSIAPTTTSNTPVGWQAADVNVTLTPTDARSGVASTQYCVDTTNTCTPATSGTSVSVTQGAGTAGTQYLRFRSTDNVGNIETIKSATVQIDKSVPADGTLSITPGNTQNSLSWTAASDTGSGLKATNTYDLRFLTGVTPPTCATGTSIYLGTGTSYTHTPLVNGTTYSYRLCAYDNVNNVSTGAFGSGTPALVNNPPAAPPQASLAQYKSDGITVVAAAAFTNSASPVMKGTVTDPEANTVQLEVEIVPYSNGFTNTPNCTSGAAVASGSTATATCGPLADGRYKWQARGKDSNGATGAWTQY